MATSVLFDLGNTLVSYYRREEFAPVLHAAVANVLDELRAAGAADVAFEDALESAETESREADDFSVRPLASRLQRIFRLSAEDGARLGDVLCERFLEPIFALGRVYEDTVPALEEIRAAGLRTGVVSNLPWGSPPEPWRRELRRLGLAPLLDSIVFCADVGRRKPAARVFEHAARQLGVSCRACLFAGDDVSWDVEGATRAGMRAVLVDREDRHASFAGERIRDLRAVVSLCGAERHDETEPAV